MSYRNRGLPAFCAFTKSSMRLERIIFASAKPCFIAFVVADFAEIALRGAELKVLYVAISAAKSVTIFGVIPWVISYNGKRVFRLCWSLTNIEMILADQATSKGKSFSR